MKTLIDPDVAAEWISDYEESVASAAENIRDDVDDAYFDKAQWIWEAAAGIAGCYSTDVLYVLVSRLDVTVARHSPDLNATLLGAVTADAERRLFDLLSDLP